MAAIGCTGTTRAFTGLEPLGTAVACTRQAGRGGLAGVCIYLTILLLLFKLMQSAVGVRTSGFGARAIGCVGR